MQIGIVCVKVKVIDAQREFVMYVPDSLSNALIEVRRNLAKEGIKSNRHIIIINGKSLSLASNKPESKIVSNDVITFVPVVLGG